MFLPLLAGLPFLSLGADLSCGFINPSARDFSICTEASRVVVMDYNGKDLSMLNSLKKVAKPLEKLELYYVYILIKNNPLLEYDEANFFPNLTSIRSYSDNHKDHSIKMVIRNNSRLCIPDEARKRFEKITNQNMFIQKCHCFTNGTMINKSTVIYGGPGCYKLTGNVIFGGGFDITRTIRRQLRTLEVIEGSLTVIETNLRNLGFLKKLRNIISVDRIPLAIMHNPALTSLQLYSLMKLESQQHTLLMAVTKNDNLRVPLKELFKYLEIRNSLKKEWNLDPVVIYYQKCKTDESMYKNLSKFLDCEYMIGDLVIDSNWNNIDRKLIVSVFSEIPLLEGCITVKGTNFKILDFFPSLRNVTCSKNRSAIIIEDNPFLQEIRLQVYGFSTMGENPAYTIQRNPRICNKTVMELRRNLNAVKINKTIIFDGESTECFDPEKESKKLEWIFNLVATGIFLTFAGMTEMVVRLRRRRKERKKAG